MKKKIEATFIYTYNKIIPSNSNIPAKRLNSYRTNTHINLDGQQYSKCTHGTTRIFWVWLLLPATFFPFSFFIGYFVRVILSTFFLWFLALLLFSFRLFVCACVDVFVRALYVLIALNRATMHSMYLYRLGVRTYSV